MRHVNPKIQSLLEFGDFNGLIWPDYVSQFGLDESDVADLAALIADESINGLPLEDPAIWGPVHAWRAIGQLKAEKAIPALLSAYDFLFDDDYALGELDSVMAMIGPAAIEPLWTYWQQPAKPEFSYAMAMDALGAIAKEHPESKDQVVSLFCRYLQNPSDQFFALNGLLIGHLLDLDARECIDLVRHLFALGCVDEACAGDLEDVEIEWGLRETRSQPRRNAPELGFEGWDDRRVDDALSDLILAGDLSEGGPSDWHQEPVRNAPKVGRNEPCPCGSGKKHKKCCLS